MEHLPLTKKEVCPQSTHAYQYVRLIGCTLAIPLLAFFMAMTASSAAYAQAVGGTQNVWVQTMDSCQQAISGAVFQAVGANIATVQTPATGLKAQTVASTRGQCPLQHGNCSLVPTGCQSWAIPIPATGIATYTIKELSAPANYMPCTGGSVCPGGPDVITLNIDFTGKVGATVRNVYPDGKAVVWPTIGVPYTGAVTDPITVHNFGIGTISCDGDNDADDRLTGSPGSHCESIAEPGVAGTAAHANTIPSQMSIPASLVTPTNLASPAQGRTTTLVRHAKSATPTQPTTLSGTKKPVQFAKATGKPTTPAKPVIPAGIKQSVKATSPAKTTTPASVKTPVKVTTPAKATTPASVKKPAVLTGSARPAGPTRLVAPATNTRATGTKKPAQSTRQGKATSPAKTTTPASVKKPVKVTSLAKVTTPASVKKPASPMGIQKSVTPAGTRKSPAQSVPAKSTGSASGKKPTSIKKPVSSKKSTGSVAPAVPTAPTQQIALH